MARRKSFKPEWDRGNGWKTTRDEWQDFDKAEEVTISIDQLTDSGNLEMEAKLLEVQQKLASDGLNPIERLQYESSGREDGCTPGGC